MENSTKKYIKTCHSIDGDTMIKVKVFDEDHEDDLTNSINEFLSERKDREFIDIRFSTAIQFIENEQIYCFSALVVYQDR